MKVLARGLRAVLAGTLLLAVVAVVPGATAGAGDDDAEALLERARAAPAAPLAGYVEVRWSDTEGTHVAHVGARSLHGAFVIGRGDDQVRGRGVFRWTGDGGGPEAVWQTVDGLYPPHAGAAWELGIAGHRTVADRPATIIEARDRDGRVRARFAVDREHGELLRRQVLDDHGHVVRSVGFVRLVTDSVVPAIPAPPSDSGTGPVPIADVPDGFVAPKTIGGYRLLGRYRHPDGAIQLYYGDGLFAVSVFEQDGDIDWGSLPAGGRDASMGGLRTHSYATASGDVVVWSDGGLVLTCVADGPPGAAATVVAEVSGLAGARDTLEQIADFVLGPFGWE
jgi:MucB/RseB N-terminal domain